MTSGSGSMARDSALYMAAKSVEGIVGVATISVLSYTLKEEQSDIYVLANITSTTAAMLAVQWLAQSAGRYLNEYELNNKLPVFYSTVFSAWLKVNASLITLAIAVRFLFPTIESGIYYLAVSYFFSYNTAQLLISLLSVRRKAVTNLFISVLSACGKLGLIFALARIIGPMVEIVFLSYIVCDFAIIITGAATLKLHKYIKRNSASKQLVTSLGRYGAPLIGNLSTTTVLNYSDRFVMKYYLPKGEVGVYSYSYSVVSAGFTMLTAALMRGSYPTILKTHATGDTALTEKLVSQAARNYLLLAVPAAVGIGVVSKPLAELLFDPRYVGGYTVMMWIGVGMLFLGLAEYSNKPWELSAQTGYIFKYSLIGGITNIVLNIVFIPRFGYMIAAYSTAFSFFVYFCLSKLKSRKLMKWSISLKTYASIIGSACAMGGVIYLLTRVMGSSGIMVFVYVAAGVAVYGALLAATGEIKEELAILARFINKRRKK